MTADTDILVKELTSTLSDVNKLIYQQYSLLQLVNSERKTIVVPILTENGHII